MIELPRNSSVLPGAPASRRHFARVLLALAAALALGPLAGARRGAAQEAFPEYQVKAALLVNFAMFVEWPAGAFPQPEEPLVIGVVGRDPFGKDLERAFAGKIIRNRRVEIRYFALGAALESCHLLYLAPGERRPQRELLLRLKQRPVLTVGEGEDFLDQGGVIQMTVSRDHNVKFAVNLDAAKPAQLKFSAGLLKLASKVRGRYD